MVKLGNAMIGSFSGWPPRALVRSRRPDTGATRRDVSPPDRDPRADFEAAELIPVRRPPHKAKNERWNPMPSGKPSSGRSDNQADPMKRQLVQNNLTHPLPDHEGTDGPHARPGRLPGRVRFSLFTMSKSDLDS